MCTWWSRGPRKAEVHALNQEGAGCEAAAVFDLETNQAPSFVLRFMVSRETPEQDMAVGVLVLIGLGPKPQAGGPTRLCVLHLPQCNDCSSKYASAILEAGMRGQLPHQNRICDASDSWAIQGTREKLRSCCAILQNRSRRPWTHGVRGTAVASPWPPGTAWSFREQ